MNRSRSYIRPNRLLAVDSLRGCAMVLVILQHCYLSANMRLIPAVVDTLLWNVTALAALAFVSISGMVYAYLLSVKGDWRLAYRRYAIRAGFLILAAHPAINLTSYYFRVAGHGHEPLLSRALLERLLFDFPITDTIGLCLLLSPIVIIFFGPVSRVVAISAMLIASALIRAFVNPAEPHMLILKEAIFGTLGLPKVFWFPLIPWLAIFWTGSFMGQALGRLKQGKLDVSVLVKKMNKAAILLGASTVILLVGCKLLKMVFGNIWNPALLAAISADRTTTMLPGYLAVLTWFLAAFMKRIDVVGQYDRLSWLLSIPGRTSLFTFVVQFAVVESVPALLGYKGMLGLSGLLSLFFAGVLVMWFLSYGYGRLRGWIRSDDYLRQVSLVGRTHST